jgi:hypothetical protein
MTRPAETAKNVSSRMGRHKGPGGTVEAGVSMLRSGWCLFYWLYHLDFPNDFREEMTFQIFSQHTKENIEEIYIFTTQKKMRKKLIVEGEENGEQARDEGAIDGRGAVGRVGVGARVFLSRCTARTCARASRVLRLGSHCRRWFGPPYKRLPCILFFSFLPSSVVRLMVRHTCAVCAVCGVQGACGEPSAGRCPQSRPRRVHHQQQRRRGGGTRRGCSRATSRRPTTPCGSPSSASSVRTLSSPLPSSLPLTQPRVVCRVSCVVCVVRVVLCSNVPGEGSGHGAPRV